MHIHIRNALIYGLIRKKSLLELYVNIFIRALAISLVGVFIPLYLYREIGYTLREVFLFYTLLFCLVVVFSPIVAKIVLKIGVKKAMLISSVLTIAFYLMLNALAFMYIPMIVLVLFYASSSQLYWVPYHIEFSRHTDHNNRGMEMGMWYSLFTSVGVIGPVLGAIIATYFNFSMLYILAIILFVLSVAPIFLIKERSIEYKFRLRSFLLSHPKKDILVYIGDGIRTVVSMVVWPFFMFIALGTYLAIGSIKSGVALLSIVVSLIVGKISDKYDKRAILRIGAVLSSITFFIRSFFGSLTSLFLITTAGDFSDVIVGVPLHSKLYDQIASKGHRKLEYIVFREVWLNSGRAVILGLIFIFGSMELSFVLTGLTNFFLFFL
ncbi:MAG: MFS transporter [Candidatus Woesearchaeota archaeon]